MNESFLHYVWQFQYFNKINLQTTEGEQVQILHSGVHNHHQGPDFSQSKLFIGDVFWAGHVEIHVQASEWNSHGHSLDPAYNNVILHVVWQNDALIARPDGSAIPTIELRQRVNSALLLQYRTLVQSGFTIPCAKSIASVSNIVRLSMLERALMHRMERKSKEILSLLADTQGDWEETAYRWIGRNFGFKVNSDAFDELARAVPLKLIRKHASNLTQVEALLFGQAGFLEYPLSEEYYVLLQREYRVLDAKYGLRPSQMKPSRWRFLRLRPANFPTLRIAQFASWIASAPNLFASLTRLRHPQGFSSVFESCVSDYWHTHYRFGKETRNNQHDLGRASIENIVINSVVPLLVAHGKATDQDQEVEEAVRVLEKIAAESNAILTDWSDLGWRVTSAFDSQGLIELYHSFCSEKRCLQCQIGNAILKPKAE